ncbi:MAG TPA: PQQ-binding-like beta-propeller repeat protein, partial [Nocardioides sp.]|nr:PQQ-binding-like beta-propeller repeat protein [Nocardioides sp.]
MSRTRAIAAWLPAVVLVPATLAAAVAVTEPDDDLAAMREEQPLDLGTTWVYDVLDHGEPSGTRTSQVVGTGSLLDSESGELRPVHKVTRSYSDYPGTGPRTNTAYLAVEGQTMYQYAQDERGTWYDIVPRLTAYRLPARTGAAWSYTGLVGDVDFSSRTELTEITDVEVGGHTFEGCAHFVNEIPLQLDDDETNDPDAIELLDEWTCPGIGTVRSRDRVEETGVDITEELVEFHGVETNWYADGHRPPPAGEAEPVAGATFGFDAGRSFAVPDGKLGRELAWTDLRREHALHPPASDGEVMVYAERDGTVSLRTTGSGEMRWRLQLRGPILTAPLIAGDAVVVADSLKQVWALSLEDGRALWVRELDDVVSAAPVLAGDRVAVPTDDGGVTALELTDGAIAWEHDLDGAARTPLAYDGEQLVAGDDSGTLTALDPGDGEVDWSTSFDPGLAQGPVIADGRVLVLDADGVVHAFSPDGDIEWQSRGRGAGDTPMVAGNGVVVTTEADEATAYDADDGRELWRRELPGRHGLAAIVGDQVVIGMRDGEVRVLGLSDGRLVDHWALPVAASGDSWFNDVAPALVGDDLVLVAAGNGETRSGLFAYPTNGATSPGVRVELAHRDVLAAPAEPPVLVGDDIVSASSTQLLRIAPDGGTTVLAETPDATHAGAVVADGVVVTRTGDQVQGLHLEDGKVLWEAPGGEPSFGTVPATDGTTVFYGIEGAGLAAVDLHSGAVRWATSVPDQETATTPLVLPDGDVVYGGGGLGRYDGATGEQEWRDGDALLYGPAAYADGVVYALTVSRASDDATLAA